jgi:hypothetical protein
MRAAKLGTNFVVDVVARHDGQELIRREVHANNDVLAGMACACFSASGMAEAYDTWPIARGRTSLPVDYRAARGESLDPPLGTAARGSPGMLTTVLESR